MLYSQAMDKTRKMSLEAIEHTIGAMGFESKWELVLYGSYSIDFALRDSDLDIVLVVDDPEGCSIDSLYQHFKVQEWLRDCNIVQIQSAKVFILEFEIIRNCTSASPDNTVVPSSLKREPGYRSRSSCRRTGLRENDREATATAVGSMGTGIGV